MKSRLPYAEVYITNVCNYNCVHCQSLNNFAFKGHQLWKDYQPRYQSWSDRLDIDIIQIMGGEPTSNPDFDLWVEGISDLWPRAKLQIATNGSRLDRIDDKIYSILAKNEGTLWITCHDASLYKGLLQFGQDWLDEIVSDSNIDQTHWKTVYAKHQKNDRLVQFLADSRILIDVNGVEVILDQPPRFVRSAIDVVANERLNMHCHDDPVRAHDVCHFKACHQMNKGKLYKCPLVSVLPDFLKQFSVDMPDNDRRLAGLYKPLSSDDPDLVEFIENITEPIPQCGFCPSHYDRVYDSIGTEKKIKIFPAS